MTVQIGDRLRATTRGTNNALGAVQNTFQLRNTTNAIAEADALTDVIAALEALYALIGAILSTLYTIQDVRVVNDTQNSDVGIGVFTDTTPGTDAGNRLPPQMAYILTLKTPLLGVNGRKFFGPGMQGDVDSNGSLVAGTLLAIADVGDFMTQDYVGASSEYEWGVMGSNPAVWRPFTSYAIGLRAGVQRRRKFGSGI